MGTQAHWRLAWMVGLAVLLAGVSAGLLCAAERAKPALPEAAVREAEPDIESLPSAAEAEVESTGAVRIAAPEPGAKLRGLAVVEVEWDDPSGYVIFRVGDRFAYATTQPYEMRWDTSTTLDGRHIVSADAYDRSGGYAGTSSISVIVENAIPTPPEGVLLTVLFDEHDLMTREIVARGELSSLGAGEGLPAGFDVLAGDLRCTLNQSVMDTFYEGASTLLRNRLRIGALVVDGESRTLPEVGLYAMVQISRNGLAIPATAATTKPRLGLGEVSAALRDYPVVPGDTWEAPIGVVCDLYTRRAVFVRARHTFDGLRWFRGRECAVVTSSYTIPKLPLLEPASRETAAAAGLAPSPYRIELTQRRGMRGERGAMRRGAGARRGAAATPRPGAAPGRAAAGEVESARLVDLEGTRRTYLTRATGTVLRTEDTILGKVEFRGAARQRAAADIERPHSIELTQQRGRQARGGGPGMRGMRGGRGGMRRGAGTSRGAAATPRPGAQPRGGAIPPRLDYGFRLTTDLVTR
jgi:hypothetical protein